MTNGGTKRNVLIVSVAATVLSYVWEYVGYTKACKGMDVVDYYCLSILREAELVILPIITLVLLLLLLSLLTYRMHDDVFRAWWNFARWMVPIIIFATIAIQFVPSNGGFFNMDGLIYLLVLTPLYAILTLGSLWRIFRKYRELKKAGK